MGLVEEIQRNIIHRPLVNELELVDGRHGVASARWRVFQRRGRRRSLLHPAFQDDDTARKILRFKRFQLLVRQNFRRLVFYIVPRGAWALIARDITTVRQEKSY